MKLGPGSTLAVLLLVAVALVACDDGTIEPASQCPRIHGGAPADALGLPASVTDAVGELVVTGDDDDALGLCTVVRIAPGQALTAAHCLDALETLGPSARPLVRFGASEGCGLAREALEPRRHPSADLAWLAFDDDLAPATLEPRAAPPAAGDEAIIAGFGLDEAAEAGALRFASTTIVEVDAGLVTVDGRGQTGACLGDSGGPLLQAVDGRWWLVGALSFGSASCHGTDSYTSLADHLAWLGSPP